MFSTSFLLTVVGLVSIVIYLGITLIKIRPERDRLRQALCKYETLNSREETEKQLDSNIQLKRNELEELDLQQEVIRTSIKKLQAKLREDEAKEYLISIEDYEPKYDFVESDHYLQRLEQIKKKQQRMRDNNEAFISPNNFTVKEGQEVDKKGKDLKKNLQEMMEFAFEEQCKYAIKKVKYNNVDALKNEINKSFEKINRYFRQIEFRISEEYLNLKFIELDLKYELEEKKQEETQRKQELERHNREIEKKKKVALKVKEIDVREKLHQQELEQVREEMAQLAQDEVEKRKQLELQNQQLEQQIAQDKRDKEKANRGNFGYIYIISNIGSLREQDVYRICMTNRKNPEEYIRELNPAVPFRFDVHFKIHSENVFDTLEKLHNRFDDKRLNKVNSRRDFFKVSLDEIEQAVKEIARETGILRIDDFERVPQAYEYRQTIAARKKNQHLASDDSYLGEDEIA